MRGSATQAPAKQPIFPRGPLIVAFTAVGLALLAAVAGRASGGDVSPPTGTAVMQRDLRFEDRDDGAVVIYAGAERRPLDTLVGENGFLRGTLRGLARTRKAEGVSAQAPFRLTAWSSGRLTLDDPSTGHRVELEAFGPTNTAVFARLLALRGEPS